MHGAIQDTERTATMQAIVQERYGGPETVQLREMAKPTAGDGQVLVRVHASSVNRGDWHLMRGKPFVIRLAGYGVLRPKHAILGQDMAGTVAAVGKNVSEFQPGDAVFGEVHGAYAEYAAVPAELITLKPANLTLAEAGAAPVAGLTALQGLRDAGRIQPGQQVLINGAAGGVGSFAVQIAKAFGAHVTGVCSTRNIEMVRAIGAERAIDYTKEDFTRGSHRYDLIFDLVGNKTLAGFKSILTPTGIYVPASDSLRRLAAAGITSMLGDRQMALFLVKPNRADLEVLRDLIEAGQVMPVIGDQYSLSEVPEAFRRMGDRHTRGKSVILVSAAAAGALSSASETSDLPSGIAQANRPALALAGARAA